MINCLKRFISTIIIMIISLALSGCGGGGGGSAVSTVSTSSPGTVTGYLYTRTSARSAGSAPAGYTPLSNTKVTCAGISATTNVSGYYEIKSVPPGQQSCSAAKTGYSAINFSVNVVSGKTNVVNTEGAVTSAVLTPEQPVIMQTAEPSLIVIAPHPDDEALGFSGVIYRETQIKNRAVAVIIMTNGDAYPTLCSANSSEKMREYGQQFTQETIDAMKLLGVPEDHIYLLGYPDGGLESMSNTNYNTPFTSNCVQANSKYINHVHEAYNPGESFTGSNVVKDLKELIGKFSQNSTPDIYTMSNLDTHPDHKATGKFVLTALNELNRPDIKVHTTMIHWTNDNTWPVRKCNQQSSDFETCQSTTSFEWPTDTDINKALIESVSLDSKAILIKRTCLKVYETRNADIDYFMSFVRNDEQFLTTTSNSMTAQVSNSQNGTWSGSVNVGQGVTYYVKVVGATPDTPVSISYDGPKVGSYTETADGSGNVTWPAVSDCSGTRPAGTYTVTITNGGHTATVIEYRSVDTSACL